MSGLDLKIPNGSIYGLLGPNGSGKTTTIRMIMSILMPDTGKVGLFGGPPDDNSRKRVGYLPEERGVYKKMKVIEQLEFLGEIRNLSRKTARKRSLAWLERLGLGEWSTKKVEDLSKGMQQKVQFVGTILHEPELLILDEPFSGLDPINQDVLEVIVREFHSSGATILFSTHLMAHAESLCESVCLISNAKKVLDGNLRDLKKQERRGIVELDFEGDDRWVNGPEIEAVERNGGTVRVRVREGRDPQELLQRGVQAGADIHRFELMEPTLHEIFVRYAGEEAAGDAGLPQDFSQSGGVS